MSSNLHLKFMKTLYNRAWLALCNFTSQIQLRLERTCKLFINLNGSKTLYCILRNLNKKLSHFLLLPALFSEDRSAD